MVDSSPHPHAPDVAERETSDNGFSAGWGLHMKPSVSYWIDCHTHLRGISNPSEALALVNAWHSFQWGHRLRRHAAVDGFPHNREIFAEAARQDDRFLWYCRMDPDQPDPDHLRSCHEGGAIGLKLHNFRLISEAMDPNLVLSSEWQEVYQLAGTLGMPIIWHVTQRLTDSPYTGGCRDSYWKEGRPKGATYSNEDLLQKFLEVVASHPETNFIGAHQLHLGPDRLTDLFNQYPNLYADTSIGCFVAADDTMYPEDAARWRSFVIANDQRLLFGSDVVLTPESTSTELLRQHFLGHVRWVKQLNLPQDSLTRIAHANFEQLTNLPPATPLPWGALRP